MASRECIKSECHASSRVGELASRTCVSSWCRLSAKDVHIRRRPHEESVYFSASFRAQSKIARFNAALVTYWVHHRRGVSLLRASMASPHLCADPSHAQEAPTQAYASPALGRPCSWLSLVLSTALIVRLYANTHYAPHHRQIVSCALLALSNNLLHSELPADVRLPHTILFSIASLLFFAYGGAGFSAKAVWYLTCPSIGSLHSDP